MIGTSLSESHTSGKVVCDRPFTATYDQMQKIVCHRPLNSEFTKKPYKFLKVTQKCNNKQEVYQTLEIKFVQSTITQTIIGVIYWTLLFVVCDCPCYGSTTKWCGLRTASHASLMCHADNIRDTEMNTDTMFLVKGKAQVYVIKQVI